MFSIPTFIEADNHERPALDSTASVIEVLRGSSAVARLTRRSVEATCNWRARGRFPPNTYLTIIQALDARGLHAQPWLWNMEPRPSANSAKVEGAARDDLWSPPGGVK